jgi:hypothetical protein
LQRLNYNKADFRALGVRILRFGEIEEYFATAEVILSAGE